MGDGKLHISTEGKWAKHSFAPIYWRDDSRPDEPRIVAGLPDGDVKVVLRIMAALESPFRLLYILHTPRGESEAARYESPALSRFELEGFLNRFGDYLGNDGRHDLWLRSEPNGAVLVWTRHNLLFAYGTLEKFEAVLRELGFSQGEPKVPHPHMHHFRSEFDEDADALLAGFDWKKFPLRPEDEQ